MAKYGFALAPRLRMAIGNAGLQVLLVAMPIPETAPAHAAVWPTCQDIVSATNAVRVNNDPKALFAIRDFEIEYMTEHYPNVVNSGSESQVLAMVFTTCNDYPQNSSLSVAAAINRVAPYTVVPNPWVPPQ
jgi:hypothetical protein